jgi:alkyldihydroxyacetonephosphate synthase
VAVDAPAAAPPPRHQMRWWGWGDDAHAQAPPAHALAWLERRLGGLAPERRPVALEDVRLCEPALPAAVGARLAEVVGEDGVRADRATRVLHAAGKGYPDLVRLRAGAAEQAPDAVVWPRSHAEVRAVLELCAREGVAVVPFGGGTSVVGGVEPWRGDFGAVVALDLGRLDALVAVDDVSLTATVEPGLRGPELEALLGARGLTLGHFPQSFEHISLGGAVATRSAGQASTGYGRIDEMVVGVRLAAPAAELELAPMPASAAGPDLRELVVGSEGVLGVITQATLRVHRRAAEARYEGWMLPSFEQGAQALRELAQEGAAPDVARLSDEAETEMSMALAGSGSWVQALARGYLRVRGVAGGCLAIFGWEDEPVRLRERRSAATGVLGRHGAVALGQSPGRAWARGRFHAPYLRDDLLGRGVMVETLETATTWANLLTLHRAVRAALERHAPLVGCHVSHLYPTGASLYFTFLARQHAGEEIEQWRAAKRAAGDAIVATGGTITHHHAVGRDHAAWLEREIGAGGVALLRAAKAQLDPAGIMNPGKLLPPGGAAAASTPSQKAL